MELLLYYKYFYLGEIIYIIIIFLTKASSAFYSFS